jgi:Tfp pilus assembly protein PilW
MHHNLNHHRGMTLIETTIYLALFSLFMTGAVIVSWQIIETIEHNKNEIMIQEEGTFLVHKIQWALTGATAAATTHDTTTLIITRPDLAARTPSQSPLTFTFDANNILLARGRRDPVSLTTGGFPVTDISFTVTPASAERPASVTVRFSIANTPFMFTSYLPK